METAVVIDPKEYGLEPIQAQEVEQVFLPVITERENLAVEYSELLKTEYSPIQAKQARELRLKLVKVRTSTDKIHKSAKAFYLAGGKFVDAWKNRNITVISEMETTLEEIENREAKIEAERILKLETERKEEALRYTTSDLLPVGLGLMRDDVFDSYIVGLRFSFEKKQEAIKQAEIDRIAKEQAEIAERERIRLENEQLKKEAEQAKAKAEAEARKQAEILAKQKAESDAKLKAEQEAKAKLQAELKAKAEAEAKAIKEKELAELQAKKEAEKLAKAPIKKQLNVWIESFELPKLTIDNEKAIDIVNKFNAFKNWAKLEIEKL